MKQQVQQPAPVSRTLQGKAKTSCQASVADVLQAYKKDIAQRQEIEDDDELLQGKFETAQRDELEEDELLQGKFETAQREELEDDELLQGKFETAQRDELDDDELLQGKFETTQRDELEDDELIQGKFETTQRKEASNNTGLPDNLKSGVEQLSGLDMSDVKVHYNSSKPAGVQAYAYTQGTDIHVAPGQEKHLGHEVWHVAQQKQGRVQPTTTVGGMPVNDNTGLESEADMMGGKAVQMKQEETKSRVVANSVAQKKGGLKLCFGFADKRSASVLQRILKTSLYSSNKTVQFMKSYADKRATTSTYLTQAQATRLNGVARSFVGKMLQIHKEEFMILPNAAARRVWLVGPALPFRVGNVVEEVGQGELETYAIDKGKRGSVITSVTLRYCNQLGNVILGPLAELDALMLDSKGKVVEVVSAKLAPMQVRPTRDRELLNYFYAGTHPYLIPNEKPDKFYHRVRAVIPTVNQQILNNNGVVGFVVEYAGGQVPLMIFRNQHPLAADTAVDTPVIGLTPKSDNVDQAQVATRRGDIQLGLNRDALLDALGNAMLALM